MVAHPNTGARPQLEEIEVKPFRETIAERDLFLTSLGFEDYAAYLSSSLWEWIVSQLSQQDGAKHCCCCGSRTGLQWHHRSYSRWVLVGNFANAGYTSIARLCMACHGALHRDFPPMEIVEERFKVLYEMLSRGCKHADAIEKALSITEEFQIPKFED